MFDTPAAVANCAVALRRSAAASLQHIEASVYGRCDDRRFIVLMGVEKARPLFVQPNVEANRSGTAGRYFGLA